MGFCFLAVARLAATGAGGDNARHTKFLRFKHEGPVDEATQEERAINLLGISDNPSGENLFHTEQDTLLPDESMGLEKTRATPSTRQTIDLLMILG